jgi:hypothetical protein
LGDEREKDKTPMTVADAFGRLRLSTLVAVIGFALVGVGSVGPWGTVGALSVSGTKAGDGVITLVCAAVGVVALVLGRDRGFAALIAGVAAVAALATAGYDTVHIAYEASKYTLFGVQLLQAGWGVYAAVIGAVIALGALIMRVSASLLRTAAIALAVTAGAGVFVAAGVVGNRNAHSFTPSAAYQSTTTATNSSTVAQAPTVPSTPATTGTETTVTGTTGTGTTGTGTTGTGTTGTGTTGDGEAGDGAAAPAGDLPAAALAAYWNDVNSGNFRAAVGMETTAEQQSASEATLQSEQPQIHAISIASSVPAGANHATARISFYAIDAAQSDNGCRYFSIDALMVQNGGSWQYAGPEPGTDTVDQLTDGNPNCPP